MLLIFLQRDKSLFERYWDIFTHSLFQVMLVVAVIVVYFFYKYYVVQDTRYTEEEEYMKGQLEYYGLRYVSSSMESNGGPFDELDQSSDIFDPVKRNYAYHRVQAETNVGKAVELWAKLEYSASQLSAVTWLPKLETYEARVNS